MSAEDEEIRFAPGSAHVRLVKLDEPPMMAFAEPGQPPAVGDPSVVRPTGTAVMTGELYEVVVGPMSRPERLGLEPGDHLRIWEVGGDVRRTNERGDVLIWSTETCDKAGLAPGQVGYVELRPISVADADVPGFAVLLRPGDGACL